MQRQQTGRTLWMVLALLAAAGVFAWAQTGDTPIVITDGSLTLDSTVPWNQYTGTGDQVTHPHTGKHVSRVEISLNGNNQTVNFAGEACVVDVLYAGTDIHAATGGNGTGLTVSPMSAFQDQNANRKRHKNQNTKISHVTVLKGGAKAFDSDAKGGVTKVTIHYQQ